MTRFPAPRCAVMLAALVLAAGCHRSAPSSALTSTPDRAALGDPGNALWTTHAPDTFVVRFATTRGPFTVQVHRDWAPLGADRFYQLVRSGYFDDSRFYRVDANYIVQFGIAGDPAVAQRWRNSRFPDDTVHRLNKPGTIGFAMNGVGTRTTQVYINLRDNARNDGQGFSPFGVVSSGMDVVQHLYSAYGEHSGGGIRGGHQDSLFVEGNAYLDRLYPRLDHLVRATIVSAR